MKKRPIVLSWSEVLESCLHKCIIKNRGSWKHKRHIHCASLSFLFLLAGGSQRYGGRCLHSPQGFLPRFPNHQSLLSGNTQTLNQKCAFPVCQGNVCCCSSLNELRQHFGRLLCDLKASSSPSALLSFWNR